MAFVVCALMMYMLWWNKPFGVDRRTTLTAITYDWREDEVALNQVSQKDEIPDFTLDDFLETSISLGDFTIAKLKDIVHAFGGMVGHIFGRPNLIYPPLDETRSVTFYATGTLFSAFHIGAWNWEFPSPIVRTLWRTFALTATGAGPAAIFIIFFIVFFKLDEDPGIVLLGILAVTYVISRLGLVVLIFYCFSSMPAGVYETVDWTKFLPHFS